VSIERHPSVVYTGSRISDWEGDIVIGKGRKSSIYTLFDRKTLLPSLMVTMPLSWLIIQLRL